MGDSPVTQFLVHFYKKEMKEGGDFGGFFFFLRMAAKNKKQNTRWRGKEGQARPGQDRTWRGEVKKRKEKKRKRGLVSEEGAQVALGREVVEDVRNTRGELY